MTQEDLLYQLILGCLKKPKKTFSDHVDHVVNKVEDTISSIPDKCSDLVDKCEDTVEDVVDFFTL